MIGEKAEQGIPGLVFCVKRQELVNRKVGQKTHVLGYHINRAIVRVTSYFLSLPVPLHWFTSIFLFVGVPQEANFSTSFINVILLEPVGTTMSIISLLS